MLKQAPLVGLCGILLYLLKVVYKDGKKERKYSDEQAAKNMETQVRILEVVKENSLEKRNLSEKLLTFSSSLTKLEDTVNRKV